MGDVKLFKIDNEKVDELIGGAVKLERKLQSLIEKHLEKFLHVRLVETEYVTGKTHGGRIDTLGLDENFCPTIIEYKRNSNANVINQGLFYLDWLMDHKGEFELLVLKKFDKATADKIDWSAPRLLCIAEDFSRYDVHAVSQINRNIELLRYVYYENQGLLMLDLVNVVVASPATSESIKTEEGNKPKNKYTFQSEVLEKAPQDLRDLYDVIKDYMLDLGDDVQEQVLKWYIAFKRMKNFACVHLQTGKSRIIIWLPIDPDSIILEDGFSSDKRGIGHWGTGDLELVIQNLDDFEKAKPIIQKSFEEN